MARNLHRRHADPFSKQEIAKRTDASLQLPLSMAKKYHINSIANARKFRHNTSNDNPSPPSDHEVNYGLNSLCMVFSSVECLQKVERSPFPKGIITRLFLLAVEANMSIPANLAYARESFSLNFEAIKNPSVRDLPITDRSVFTQGIRNRPSFEG